MREGLGGDKHFHFPPPVLVQYDASAHAAGGRMLSEISHMSAVLRYDPPQPTTNRGVAQSVVLYLFHLSWSHEYCNFSFGTLHII